MIRNQKLLIAALLASAVLLPAGYADDAKTQTAAADEKGAPLPPVSYTHLTLPTNREV